ncbi:MAG: ABC transporter ATP-binding protein [Desulfobacterium sp.]
MTLKQFQLLKPYLLERKFHIAAGLLCLLLVDLFQLFIPRIVKWAIDDITLQSSSRGELFKYGLYIALSAMAIGVFRFCWRYFIMGTARRMEEGIRGQLFDHIQTLPTRFFDTTSSGDIMAHATNDMTSIRMALGMGIVGLTDTIVLGCAAIFFMAYINLELTLLALLPMPFIALLTKILSKKLFLSYREVQESFSHLMESTRERFAGIRIIKAFNREATEVAGITRESNAYITSNMKLVKLRGMIFPLVIFLNNVSLAIILGAGGRKVILADISTGDFVAFISYLNLLTWPVMAVGWVTNMIQRGKASIDRIIAILDVPGEAEKPGKIFTPSKIHGEISVDNISFSFDKKVIDGVGFKLQPGEVLGIAGPPGSGKTTLANLLPRLYDPDEGIISIDGMDIGHISLKTLRQSISFMPQEPFLFSGTIEANLRFGDPGADDEKINKALAMAGLTETISGFPRGLDTLIGEKGVMLSGGQKQRIALARAFLKDAPILILDDPVSQVDMATASDITRIIDAMAGKKTIIIISHRFSIFKNADHVMVLYQGRVVEQGTHPELIDHNGYYARSWQMQETEAALVSRSQ